MLAGELLGCNWMSWLKSPKSQNSRSTLFPILCTPLRASEVDLGQAYQKNKVKPFHPNVSFP